MGLGLVCSTLAAYAIVRADFLGKEFLFKLIVSFMALPAVVILIPLYRVMVTTHLVDTYQGLILIYSGLIIPFSVYLLASFFVTIPSEILDAALIDGCSFFGILIRIYIPLSKAGIITCVVVNFSWLWSELLIGMVFMQDPKLKTLMPGIVGYLSRYEVNIPVLMAGLIVATVPILAVYIGGSRFYIKGIMSGFRK